jgi:prepilin-type N-terminal cleavage/methylation domain-containing protein
MRNRTGWTARLRARLRQERGFTLVELLATMTLLTVGVIATAATFDHSRRATTSAERIEAMAHKAQREIEQIQSLTYAETGLSTVQMGNVTASGSGDVWDPANFVFNGSPKTFATDWNNVSTSKEPFVSPATDATCTCATLTYKTSPPGSDRYQMTVWRFITFVDDTCNACTGTQEYKRITVAITVPNFPQGVKHAPYVTSTIKRP